MPSTKHKRVLVTGAGGFIGSHLAERLVHEGVDVTAMVHYNARGSNGWLDESPLSHEMRVIAGDIRDSSFMQSAIEDQDCVYHLAALIAIPYSYVAPESYVQTNIFGTLNVMQAAKRCCTPKVVHTSTSEVYGTAKYVPIDESHPLQGQSPYSASKIGADKIAESFALSFELPVVTVRPFNTFGPRQSARAVIPTIISQLIAHEKIKLGSLKPTRDLNYVENTVDGFIAAALSDKTIGRTVNLGSGREISIGDLAKAIAEQMDIKVEITTDEQRLRPQSSEVNRLLASNELAMELMEWAPRISMEDGLVETIEWFRGHIHHYRPDQYTT